MNPSHQVASGSDNGMYLKEDISQGLGPRKRMCFGGS